MRNRRIPSELRIVAAALSRCISKYPRGTEEHVALWWMAMNVSHDLTLFSDLTPAEVAQFRRSALGDI